MPTSATLPLSPLLRKEGNPTLIEASNPLLSEEETKGWCGAGFGIWRKNQKASR
jgi:hypothetical protein